MDESEISITEIPADQQAWINEMRIKDETLDEAEVKEWFLKHVVEFKTLGYANIVDTLDEFYDAVQANVLGEITLNMSVPPTDVNMFIFGNYPIRPAGNSNVCEVVGLASLTGDDPEFFAMSMWDKDAELRKDYEPLATIRTGASYFPEDKEKGRYKFTAQKATDLSPKSAIDWISKDYNEKLEWIRGNAPHIKLGDIHKKDSLSNLLPPKDDKKSSYVDSINFKRLIVSVKEYVSGTDKNGRDWAMYQVIDGTFQANAKNKSFPVWVDPVIGDRIGAGPGSILEIVGYTSKSAKDGSISMTACFVHPRIVKDMPANSGIQKDTAPQVGIQTSVPVVQMVTHPDGL
ncbi:MAG: hypothetical protein KAS32_04425 [Candidatus Peribacteraceae bacterium]|nr:hypothetical protein [Candidatus Peribacteraceae bacterium]